MQFAIAALYAFICILPSFICSGEHYVIIITEAVVMNYHMEHNRVWLEDDEGKEIAYVTFPAFEPGMTEVTHTFVDSSLRGQGVAGILMDKMVEVLRETGQKAELTCSYAMKWFMKHPECQDVLIDPEAEAIKASGGIPDACRIPRHKPMQ